MTAEPGPFDGPDWQAAKRRAEEPADMFPGHQVIAGAELAAHGIHPVSVAHGTPETDEDAHLIFEVLPRLAGECGAGLGRHREGR